MIEVELSAVSGEPFEWRHPVDEIEPELTPADKIHDAQMMTVHLLNDFAVEMLAALTSENPVRSALTKLHGIAFGMGLGICDGVSMTATAARIGVERATISKIAVSWNVAHDLPPSWGQKSEAANANYAAARRAVVKGNGNGHSANGAPRCEVLPTVPNRGRSA